MANFKPCYSYRDSNRKLVHVSVKTYALIKKNLRTYISDSENGEVSVYRSRKSEWGEWFEHWRLVNNKPTIVKEGWS